MNKILLLDNVKKSGLKRKAIAEKLSISRYALLEKLNGITEFKVSEVSKLSDILRLSDAEILENFFKHNVDL